MRIKYQVSISALRKNGKFNHLPKKFNIFPALMKEWPLLCCTLKIKHNEPNNNCFAHLMYFADC